MRWWVPVLASLLVLFFLPATLADDEAYDVSVADLVAEMGDLRHLTRLPDPPFVTRQASSYDRRSKTPEDPMGWFANRDAGNFQRVEEVDGQKRYVLLDVAGPGAVVRIWSANPKGTLRVEIDGEVAIEAPMADLLGGKVAPFDQGLAYVVARGFNLYYPFPYQERCCIWSDEGGFYYHVGYRTYAPGTRIQPYHRDAPLAAGYRAGPGRNVVGRIARDRPFVLRHETGAVITCITLHGVPRDAKQRRRTLLTIRFDGTETVRVPLDAFRVPGPGFGMAVPPPCVWPMPYRSSAEIGLAGDGLDELSVIATVGPRPWTDDSLHFHAVWRAEHDIPTSSPRDWTLVDVEGEGVYAGNALFVANPVRSWWGEGDEKIWVDGETFPSTFGTGTEDYYGYAWCSPELFEARYHGQPRCDGPGNFGHTLVYRWHVLDPVPFRQRLRFDLEVLHHRQDVQVHLGAMSVFYARPGARVQVPQPVDATRFPPDFPEPEVMTIPGALEGEKLGVQASSGVAEHQDLSIFGGERWSRGAHLWWRGAEPGAELEIGFPAPADGAYRVIAYLTQAPDYGQHLLFASPEGTGQPPGRSVDLWAESVQPSRPVDLGVWELKAAGNVLGVRVIGKNPRAVGDGYMFGLDCLVLLEIDDGEDDEGDEEEERPPNVVIVFTDDQGYADVGVYGAQGFETPHLDRLAAEGMHFTSFYVSEATCSASRASLLTGCYAKRVSMPGALNPHATVGLHWQEETIADLLRANGYATAAIGKWHLGHVGPFLPGSQGFDEYLGIPYSNDMWPVGYDGVRAEKGRKRYYPELPLIDGVHPVAEIREPADQDTLTTRYTERAVAFIEKNRDRPFFLYLAHSMPHVPLGVSSRFRGQSEQGRYGDVLMEIDDSVGQVLAALEEHGLSESTLVVFTSDNGPWLNFGDHAGSAGRLREGKGTAWEGGVRVPCIVRWPGHVPAGVACDELAATIDLLPTIADLTGAPLPQRKIDGVSLADLLLGKTATSPRDHFLYYYTGELRAVRQGRYKLVLPHTSRSYAGPEPGEGGLPGPTTRWTGGPLLFDLEADVGETTDVLAAHHDVVARLEALAERAREELGDTLTHREGTGVRPIGRAGESEARKLDHRARGKPITLTPSPSPKYAAKGAPTLLDGVGGSADFTDGAWLGFQGVDLEAVIDLGAPVPIRSVSVSCLESQAVWIFPPRSIEVACSVDGETFKSYGETTRPAPAFDPQRQVHSFSYSRTWRAAMGGRYVRVRIRNLGVCPEWHPGAGGKAWLFVDEIVVR